MVGSHELETRWRRWRSPAMQYNTIRMFPQSVKGKLGARHATRPSPPPLHPCPRRPINPFTVWPPFLLGLFFFSHLLYMSARPFPFASMLILHYMPLPLTISCPPTPFLNIPNTFHQTYMSTAFSLISKMSQFQPYL